MKKVMLLAGAGQIGMAIARRMGAGMKIVVGDKKLENAQAIAKTMNEAGFDAAPMEMDLSSRDSIKALIAEGQKYGPIQMLVNAAGVSPSQAPIEAILKVDLYGTAVLLEEVGKVIAEGGVGVTISSQSGWRMPALTAEQDIQLATTPTEELRSLDFLQPENIRDTLHAYQLAKRCNEKRVMAQAVEWGKRGARLNDIAPGIIVTLLALDEFNGPRGDFYKNMFAKCPAGRPGTADEVANVAELLMSDKGAFISGATFLIDGGATASYYYGPLKPETPTSVSCCFAIPGQRHGKSNRGYSSDCARRGRASDRPPQQVFAATYRGSSTSFPRGDALGNMNLYRFASFENTCHIRLYRHFLAQVYDIPAYCCTRYLAGGSSVFPLFPPLVYFPHFVA